MCSKEKNKRVVSLLMLFEVEGLAAFTEIPYLQIIRPLVWRDRRDGLSYQQIANRYNVTFAQARRIIESLLKDSKDSK